MLPRNALFTICLMLLTAWASLSAKTELGIDVLEKANFKPLIGKRVGLLTNPAGVNMHGVSTVEVLRNAPNVDLEALFGPEHGIYGDEKANVPVDDKIDPRTGLPVFSLYGKYRKPTPKMLSHIDVLVIDLQDLGVRSYTYISCMRYAIEACFENGVDVIVLDRPNPLGGLKVDGPGLDEEWMSYVGAYPIPYVHGLTIGEIARMSKKEPGWLKIDDEYRKKGKLLIVPMHGWQRHMQWTDTGLGWVPTSPAIQDLPAAMGYAMTGLGTLPGQLDHGYGTPFAFRLLNFEGHRAEKLLAEMKSRNIPGMDFRLIRYQDKKGVQRQGVYTLVKDWDALRPTEVSFHMHQLYADWAGNHYNKFSNAKKRQFNIHTGSTEWWEELVDRGANARVQYFVEKWRASALAFQAYSRKYWLYQ